MTESSGGRQYLSRLMRDLGSDGVLIVPNTGPGQGGIDADLVPGAALRWPPCKRGHSLCPDLVPPDGDG
ncbi:hypothetical protein [Streptomyces sp. NPDC017520]|uniref:hypothetical protein n=1 Tax=Streptomyces sp. NPDC017520 TaxID=3364998 RepID=UPI00378C5286